MCERWNSFENFLNDMGVCPKGLSLDRINNDGNYEPSNCRWTTWHVQSRNTRKNVWVDLNGERKCLTDAAAAIGVNVSAVIQRIKRGKEALAPRHITHKRSRSSTYRSWLWLRKQNQRHLVCENWTRFENFFSDMGECPKGRVLTRINKHDIYSAENCKWATRHESSRSMTTNVWVVFQGQTLCLSDAAKAAGLKLSTVTQRRRRGHDLFSPLKSSPKP
jgi:hypothetical protein